MPEDRMLDWSDRPPAATLDLHGQSVTEAADNVERFLRAQGKARPGAVVRLVTGRGKAGGGAPIRTRVRARLRAWREQGTMVRDYVMEETEGSFLVRLIG
jgi:DNA-nicking Smr family endonuclease